MASGSYRRGIGVSGKHCCSLCALDLYKSKFLLMENDKVIDSDSTVLESSSYLK